MTTNQQASLRVCRVDKDQGILRNWGRRRAQGSHASAKRRRNSRYGNVLLLVQQRHHLSKKHMDREMYSISSCSYNNNSSSPLILPLPVTHSLEFRITQPFRQGISHRGTHAFGGHLEMGISRNAVPFDDGRSLYRVSSARPTHQAFIVETQQARNISPTIDKL